MKKLALVAGLGFLALLAVLVVRALLSTAPTLGGTPVEIPLDEEAMARRLGEAIRIRTVSPGPPAVRDPAPFEEFLAWVEGAYPLVHASLKREVVGGLSLLYTWPGSDPSASPILLTAHHDVVPVNPGSEEDWSHAPFGGEIDGGYVWGRGALDDKSGVITLLEAVTLLLEEGFAPKRTVYLAFGHDEEIGGVEGAGAITKRLRDRGVKLAWSLDEGSFVLDGMYPGVDVPVASINVAEKGYLTLDLVARGQGGHSSIPPPETAVGTLARAILRVQESPLPGGIDGVTAASVDALAPHMPFYARVLFANRWLFGPLIEQILGTAGPANAVLRTTTAPTMLEGSVKENVLPTEAVGTVNFRLHPRDDLEGVVMHVEEAIDDDRVEVRVRRAGNPASEVSRTGAAGFRAIADAVGDVYGPVAVIPGLTVGGTDSRHYGQIAEDAYRFTPMRVTPEDVAGFHGTNERISIENLAQGTRVYVQLLRRANAME